MLRTNIDIYRAGGNARLVFNTNLTIAEFEAQFGTKEGPAFTRRIGKSMEVFNFF
jgi:hypothetical protein